MTRSERYDTVIRGGHVVLDGHGVSQVDLGIVEGRIAAIANSLPASTGEEVIDASGLHVLPGAVDSHVHWGYHGDFRVQCGSDSLSAAIGGTTTAHVLHRVAAGAFEELVATADEVSAVDYILTPAVFSEATAGLVASALEDWGVASFKFYLAYKPVDGHLPGDDWNELTDGLMADALATMQRYEGTLACVHAENPEIIARAAASVQALGGDGLEAWEQANPSLAEVEGIHRAGVLCAQAGVPLYLVHLSGRDALEAVERVRAWWPQTYAETCPHYLVHNIDGSPTAVKFSPPVRHSMDNEALWDALRDGTLNCVGSDNSSSRSPSKEGDVWKIDRGGPNAGLLLPIVLSEGVNAGRLSLERAVEVVSSNAAKIFGIYPRKGSLSVSADADLVVVDLDREQVVSPELLRSWSDYTLYDGRVLKGWPVLTMIRGQVVVRELEPQAAPSGRYVPRRASRQPHGPAV